MSKPKNVVGVGPDPVLTPTKNVIASAQKDVAKSKKKNSDDKTELEKFKKLMEDDSEDMSDGL